MSTLCWSVRFNFKLVVRPAPAQLPPLGSFHTHSFQLPDFVFFLLFFAGALCVRSALPVRFVSPCCCSSIRAVARPAPSCFCAPVVLRSQPTIFLFSWWHGLRASFCSREPAVPIVRSPAAPGSAQAPDKFSPLVFTPPA
jgi:hypothetical protein